MIEQSLLAVAVTRQNWCLNAERQAPLDHKKRLNLNLSEPTPIDSRAYLLVARLFSCHSRQSVLERIRRRTRAISVDWQADLFQVRNAKKRWKLRAARTALAVKQSGSLAKRPQQRLDACQRVGERRATCGGVAGLGVLPCNDSAHPQSPGGSGGHQSGKASWRSRSTRTRTPRDGARNASELWLPGL